MSINDEPNTGRRALLATAVAAGAALPLAASDATAQAAKENVGTDQIGPPFGPKSEEDRVFDMFRHGVFFDAAAMKKAVQLAQESAILREYMNPDRTRESMTRAANVLKRELENTITRPMIGGPEAGGGAPVSAEPTPYNPTGPTAGDIGDALEAGSELANGAGYGYVGAMLYLASAVFHVVDVLAQ